MKEQSSQPQGNKNKPGRTKLSRQRTRFAKRRTDLAEERTNRARYRTMLANERNFSAWLRSGLASIGVGLAVAELLRNTGGSILARIFGVILVILGLLMAGVAFWRYQFMSDLLQRENAPVMPVWLAGLMVGSVAIGSVLVLNFNSKITAPGFVL